MLYIPIAVMMRENIAQPPRKSLTPDDGSLMPPAILSGRKDKKQQKSAGRFHRAARPLPGAASTATLQCKKP